jgi:hypothetical protein
MRCPEGIFYIRQVLEDITVRGLRCNVPYCASALKISGACL